MVKFEHVKHDAFSQVKRMLEFLHIPYSDSKVEWRLSKGFGMFQRIHHEEDFDPYTTELRAHVQNGIGNIIA